MNKIKLLLLLCLVPEVAPAQQKEILFRVFLKGEAIGKLNATETRNGTDVIRDVKSESEAHMLSLPVHVQTNTKITSGNKVLLEGIAWRLASRGARDLYVTTKRLGPSRYQLERNGRQSVYDKGEITLCVPDLFFEEPIGKSNVYSSILTEMLVIKELGNGQYLVMSCKRHSTVYTYSDGILMLVESETPAGTVISKRI